MKRGRLLALALLAGLCLGAQPDPEDPPLCRDALAAHSDTDALDALAREEARLSSEARKASREARKLMRKTLGSGTQGSAVLPQYEALMREQEEATRQGKVICLCRERRNDPHREDCELLYPIVIR